MISKFFPCDLRTGIGTLWENFLISERVKNNAFHAQRAKYYFWRITQKQEIDFIEEIDGNLSAFEFKYNPKRKCKVSAYFFK